MSDEKEKFDKTLRKSYPAVEKKVLNWIETQFLQNIPKEVFSFLKCLSSTSPVCSYAGTASNDEEVLLDLCCVDLRSSIVLWQSIHQNFPLIFQVLVRLKRSTLSQEWDDLFVYLKLKAEQP